MKERAYAKINLCLDVVGRRDDGYHELKMIMVPVLLATPVIFLVILSAIMPMRVGMKIETIPWMA